MLVELKARFDEENNIVWAKMLEKAGCHVIYGLVGLKTHSKITLVVRREEDGHPPVRPSGHRQLQRCHRQAVHGLRTSDRVPRPSARMPRPSSTCFPVIRSRMCWNKLTIGAALAAGQVPGAHRQRAGQCPVNGHPARIIAKMNSLCDQEIIAALYEASRGRGKDRPHRPGHLHVCGPGIPGVSENITVRSIVGNFLEHSQDLLFR